MTKRRADWSALAWLLFVPIVASSALRDLWAPDEPRYAEVAREVYERPSFLVMHLCDAVYPDKPPLLFWSAGLFGVLSGWSVFVMRLVSILATGATAWLVARFARRWWGAREAAWAPVLYLGTAMVTEIGGRLQIDPLMSALCVGALWLASRGEEPGPAGPPGSSDASRTGRDALLAGGLVGLAALAKGPVVFVIVGLVLLAWRHLVPRPAAVSAPRPRLGRRALVGALLLAVLPVLVWALAAAAVQPGLGRELFYGQHVERVVEEEVRHGGPIWDHLVHMPLLLLPWTPAVALGLVAAWRARRSRAEPNEPGDLGDPGLVRAGLWLLVLLLFFSVIPPKRDLYLLPAYPAAALLGARWLALAIERERLPRAAALFATVPLLLLGAAFLSLPLAAGVGVELGEVAPFAWRAHAVGWVLLAGSAASLVAIRRRDPAAWARRTALTWAAWTTLAAVLVLSPLNEHKSARGLGEALAARPEAPVDIPCVGVPPEGYRFYGEVPAVRAASLEPALERDGADFLALVDEKTWEELAPELRARVRVLAERGVGHRHVRMLGAAPAGGRGWNPPPGK